MTVEIISWSISTKVWDRAGIELATPGSAVRNVSVARHVTDCATRPGDMHICVKQKQDQTLLWTWVAGAYGCVNSLYAKFKFTGMKSDYTKLHNVIYSRWLNNFEV